MKIQDNLTDLKKERASFVEKEATFNKYFDGNDYTDDYKEAPFNKYKNKIEQLKKDIEGINEIGNNNTNLNAMKVIPETNKSIPKNNKEDIAPSSFDEYIGQDNIKRQLKVAIISSIKRDAPLPHILLAGPAGVGKTTLANIIAKERNVYIKHILGLSLQTPEDLFITIQPLITTGKNNILFVDEIHRMPQVVQEAFYTLMENNTISVKSSTTKKPVTIVIDNPITIIGATTNPGKLTKPLYSRFDMKLVLQNYLPSELEKIVKFTASKLNMPITDEAAFDLAKRGHGSARDITKFVKLARDVALALDKNIIDDETVETTFYLYKIDENGLREETEIKYLKYLATIFPNKIGIDSISEILMEDKEFILKQIEPVLINMGLVIREKTGRTITEQGLKYLLEHGHISEQDYNALIFKANTGF